MKRIFCKVNFIVRLREKLEKECATEKIIFNNYQFTALHETSAPHKGTEGTGLLFFLNYCYFYFHGNFPSGRYVQRGGASMKRVHPCPRALPPPQHGAALIGAAEMGSKASLKGTASHELSTVFKKFRTSKPLISEHFYLRSPKFSSAEFCSRQAAQLEVPVPPFPCVCVPVQLHSSPRQLVQLVPRAPFPGHLGLSAGTQGDGMEGRELSPVNNAGQWLCALQHFSSKLCPVNT